MKFLKTIFFVLVLVSGCRTPDYVTSHGVQVYNVCDNPDYEFPTLDEVELFLDHMLENAHRCLPTAAEDISIILSNIDLYLKCTKPAGCANCGGKHYDTYYRDEIVVHWDGYDRIYTMYHEIMHPAYRYYRGGTDHNHEDKIYWLGDRCLTELFQIQNGWAD